MATNGTTAKYLPLEVRLSDLYQNGKVVQVGDSDELLLLRDVLGESQEITDEYLRVIEGDELPLVAFNKYRTTVANANLYWWLVADRNGCFDPLALTFIDADGIEREISEIGTLVVPNILTQQPKLRR